jgi:hypothetical protein
MNIFLVTTQAGFTLLLIRPLYQNVPTQDVGRFTALYMGRSVAMACLATSAGFSKEHRVSMRSFSRKSADVHVTFHANNRTGRLPFLSIKAQAAYQGEQP